MTKDLIRANISLLERVNLNAKEIPVYQAVVTDLRLQLEMPEVTKKPSRLTDIHTYGMGEPEQYKAGKNTLIEGGVPQDAG